MEGARAVDLKLLPEITTINFVNAFTKKLEL